MNLEPRQRLDKLLKEEWYAQGLPCTPLFIMSVSSMPVMKKGAGYSYHSILCLYKDDYAEWSYPQKDLEKYGNTLLQVLAKNPGFLKEKRLQYEKENKAIQPVYDESKSDLGALSNERLIQLLYHVSKANKLSVGTSHLIEALSLALEREVRHLVLKKVLGKNANEVFSTLTSPVTPSFFSQKEKTLWEIKKSSPAKKTELAREFIRKYYWLNSSYIGSQEISVEELLKESEQATQPKKPDFESLKKEKQHLFQELGFSNHAQNLISWTEFATDWQDNRKEKILNAQYCLQRVIREIANRFAVNEKALHYLLAEEITLENLQNGQAEKTGRLRIKGCVTIDALDGQFLFSVPDFEKIQQKFHQHHTETETLYGTSASLGTATGPVKICTTMQSINELKEGDVLVASMTRPEYVPAMKKAAAIITDEGGVTCHAAIVSRELGIPCVIGTRNATKVLKDGWLVQVKANHGQVIVLEKKSK